MSKPRRYAFDEDEALEYGVEAAVLMSSFRFWIDKNRAAGDMAHFHEGRWWTYNTVQGLAKSFPFWSPPQIRRLLDRLKESGVLLVGTFNKTAYDRTAWYAFADEDKHLPEPDTRNQKRQIHLTKSANGNDESSKSDLTKSANGIAETGKPIPVSASVGNQLVPSDVRPLAPAAPLRKADPLFDALTEELGISPAELTPTGRGAVNKALKELRAVGATPEEIRRRCQIYRRTYPNLTLTAPALAKHWPQLGRAPAPPESQSRINIVNAARKMGVT